MGDIEVREVVDLTQDAVIVVDAESFILDFLIVRTQLVKAEEGLVKPEECPRA